ncbi:MAG: YvcK family protein, partial [Chloroflexi bacterium]|nr:YvcK family protein [Chloroflexota bacterium]
SQVAARLSMALGLEIRVLPMTDDHFRTRVRTPAGVLAFQEYFVKRRQQDDVLGIEFEGANAARPAPGVLETLRDARTVAFAPSNPYVSIGPILSLPGVREILRERRERVVAISPIVGGAAIKGPAANMLRTLGMEVSAVGVAALYRDIVGTFILDEVDAELAPRVASLGMRPIVTQTMMRGPNEKRALAARALEALS